MAPAKRPRHRIPTETVSNFPSTLCNISEKRLTILYTKTHHHYHHHNHNHHLLSQMPSTDTRMGLNCHRLSTGTHSTAILGLLVLGFIFFTISCNLDESAGYLIKKMPGVGMVTVMVIKMEMEIEMAKAMECTVLTTWSKASTAACEMSLFL